MTSHSDVYCVFCEIISGNEPAEIYYTNDDFIVFKNNLHWFPTQLLFVPLQHMSQSDLWSSESLISQIAKKCNEVGETECPGGYRILSNFGEHGMQSQPHAHVHLIGGKRLGLYANLHKSI